jgi:hypothetical protein
MLNRFVDGLKVAAGSAHQLAHAQQNSNWLKVRDILENLIESGQKLAVAKAMPRATLLQEMDIRAKRIKDLN